MHKPVPGVSVASMEGMKWVMHRHIPLSAASIASRADIICAKHKNKPLPGLLEHLKITCARHQIKPLPEAFIAIMNDILWDEPGHRHFLDSLSFKVYA